MCSPVITSNDSAFTIPTALSVIREGNPDLDEYSTFLSHVNPLAIERVNGHVYSIFPLAISLTAVPFVAVADSVIPPLLKTFPILEEFIRHRARGYIALPEGPLDCLSIYPAIELGIASFYTALAVSVFFSLACHFLSFRKALLLTVLLALGTSAWSTASRALWQHGPAMLMFLFALHALVTGEKPKAGWAGFCLAIAYLIRPTFALPLAATGLFLLINHRGILARFVLSAAIPLGLFAIWNLVSRGQILPAYFAPNRLTAWNHIGDALLGNLVSPARGLLVYSPFLILVVPYLFKALRPQNWRNLSFYLAWVIPAHWVLISTFPHWWGGYSIGPRFMTDLLPIFFWLLIPAANDFSWPSHEWRKRAASLAAATLCLWSVWAHGHGATSMAVYFWNSRPVSVDQVPARLWDWADPPFLRFSNTPLPKTTSGPK